METDLRKPADGGSVATPYGRRSSGSSAAGQCSFRSEVDPPFLKHPKGLGSWYRWNERLSVWWRGRDGASMTIAPGGRRHVKSREGSRMARKRTVSVPLVAVLVVSAFVVAAPSAQALMRRCLGQRPTIVGTN